MEEGVPWGVPWGVPCARLKGSAPRGSCKSGVPTNSSEKLNVNRRYAVDESVGSVQVR